MATRSQVFVVGSDHGVYAHYDGYPQAMIPLILDQYREAGGDLGVLAKSVIKDAPDGHRTFGEKNTPCGGGCNTITRGDRQNFGTEYEYEVSEDGIRVGDLITGYNFQVTWAQACKFVPFGSDRDWSSWNAEVLQGLGFMV